MTIEEKEDMDVSIAVFCLYCGSLKVWQMFPEFRGFETHQCEKCSISVDARKGTRIVYGSPERSAANAVYADNHLTRGTVYTLRKVKREQHAAYAHLIELPKGRWNDPSFNLGLFTPVGFQRPAPDFIATQKLLQAKMQEDLDKEREAQGKSI